MLFSHLNRSLTEGRAYQVENLINGKLKGESIANLDFYLPQIWYERTLVTADLF
jgi:hypothetical protein